MFSSWRASLDCVALVSKSPKQVGVCQTGSFEGSRCGIEGVDRIRNEMTWNFKTGQVDVDGNVQDLKDADMLFNPDTSNLDIPKLRHI